MATSTTASLPGAGSDDRGVLSWILSTSHRRIALMQLVGIGGAFAVGGLFALLMQIERATAGHELVSATFYRRSFTFHGLTMLFLVALPSVGGTLGGYLLPLQLGARNVAFPKLYLASFHVWIIGAALLFVAMLYGGSDAGWRFAPPYSLESGGHVAPMLLGVIALSLGAIFRSVTFIVTVHQMRAAGLSWRRLPAFVWSLYAHSVMLLLAAPVLVFVLVLLLTERLGVPWLFDPSAGGELLLYEHLFWFAAHAAIYSVALPAFGVLAEVISTFARRVLFARRTALLGLVGFGVLTLFAWGQHMLVSGSLETSTLFSLAALLTALPCAWMLGSAFETLRRGRPEPAAPLLFALGSILLFVVGGLGGLAAAAQSLGVHLHGTVFVVAHSHFMLAGGVGMALLAGLHYWWPKLTGKLYDERAARWVAVGLVLGHALTYLPRMLAGARGLSRRGPGVPEGYLTLEQLSMVGSAVLFAAFFAMALYLGRSLSAGQRAEANPFRADGAEWAEAEAR
jgi:cytochrome c oxidase subunit 1